MTTSRPTRHALYAHLAPPHMAHGSKGLMRPWTPDECLQLLHAYAADTGTLPSIEDCCPAEGLPSYAVILRLFGSIRAYLAHCPDVPRRPQEAHRVLRQRGRDLVPCLRCGMRWHSPDKRRLRICPTCATQPHDEDGAWMGHGVVRNMTHTTMWQEPEGDPDGHH